MFNETIMIILLTFLPFLELRYSIPAGILTGRIELPFGIVLQGFGLNWLYVFFVCVITNIILGILLYCLLDVFVKLFCRIKFFSRLYNKAIVKPRRKINKYVEKYGEIGLALFIAIPLPGSGVYTGALGGYALGISYRKFIKASIIGVTIAGVLVTAITLSSIGIINSF